jgi:hypothetical protein
MANYNNFYPGNNAPVSASHHAKKGSHGFGTSGIPSGTQTLKQSLKDLQEMLKLTQNKLSKQGGSINNNPTPTHQYASSKIQGGGQDEASFLKKLSKQ